MLCSDCYTLSFKKLVFTAQLAILFPWDFPTAAITEQGTIKATWGLLPESNPTAFQELRPAGRGRRRMFDRRRGTFVTLNNVHLFKASTVRDGIEAMPASSWKIFPRRKCAWRWHFDKNLQPVTPRFVACRKSAAVVKKDFNQTQSSAWCGSLYRHNFLKQAKPWWKARLTLRQKKK